MIVVAYDGTQGGGDGVLLGRVLSELTGRPLEVLEVDPHPGTMDPAAVRDTHQAHVAWHEAATGLLGDYPADVSSISDRSPQRALARVTAQPDVTMLVLGSSHRGPLGRLVVGMGAEYVLPHAERPVAIAPPGFRRRAALSPPVVGVAYDGTDSARRAVTLGAELAATVGVPLRVLTVAHGNGTPDQDALDALRAELAAAHDGLEVQARLLTGRPERELVTESADVGILLAGAHRHSAARRVLFGTVASGLVRHSAAPVVIVPAG